MWDHMSGYGGWMGFGTITMLLVWIFLVLAIAVLWQRLVRNASTRPSAEKDAMTILAERYARGEIGKEEFLEKRKDLGPPSS